MITADLSNITSAVAYARYSTDNQTENSIAYQLSDIQKYCVKNNIVITQTYIDEAFSGTNTNRPGYQDMMAAAERGEFRAVVIDEITRGSRDVEDWFHFRKTLTRLGVRVLSTDGSVGDYLNPSDFLTELISVGLGQHQVLTSRVKSIAGMAERAKKGIFCGGVAPLGYDINPRGEYVINEREAALVRRIFELYACGRSYANIIDELDGAVGKGGRPIGKNSLSSILRNERYIGIYTWNKYNTRQMRRWIGYNPNPNMVKIEGQIPPIIDPETWEKVRMRMRDRSRAENKAKREYLLSGLIECTQCHATYVGHTSVNQKGYESRYYVCGNKYRTRTCDAHNIQCEAIDSFVVLQLKEFLSSQNMEELAQTIADQVNGASADLSAEKKELAQIKEKISNGMQAVLGGFVFPELQEEIDRLRSRQSDLEDIIRVRSNGQTVSVERIAAMLRWAVAHFDTDRKEAVRSLVNKIYANPDGSYTVQIGVHFMAPQVGLEPTTS